jgi:serine/threonine protein kinase
LFIEWFVAHRCKICDFGLARTKEVTKTMTTIGTPAYTAPEVLGNERYSEKADVFSFGTSIHLKLKFSMKALTLRRCRFMGVYHWSNTVIILS